MPDEKVENTEVKKEISESPEVPKELETKTTEDVKQPKTQPEPEPSKREVLEKKVIDYNRGVDETPKEEETKPEEESKEDKPKEEESTEETEELSLEDRIKKKVHKRIGKEVAKRKTAEERVTELEAENAALKVKREDDAKPKEEAKDPTDDQIDTAYQKALEDGDHKYAAEINRYAINKARKDGLAEADAKTHKVQKAQQETRSKWVSLVQDHTVYLDDKRTQMDMEHPLNLNNSNSDLYKTAMSFMQDKDLAKENGYDNPDKILGFRLAVNDARRELMDLADQGKLDLTSHLKKNKKENLIKTTEPKKRRKSELVSSAVESSTESETPSNETPKSLLAKEVARRKAVKEHGMVPQKVNN